MAVITFSILKMEFLQLFKINWNSMIEGGQVKEGASNGNHYWVSWELFLSDLLSFAIWKCGAL